MQHGKAGVATVTALESSTLQPPSPCFQGSGPRSSSYYVNSLPHSLVCCLFPHNDTHILKAELISWHVCVDSWTHWWWGSCVFRAECLASPQSAGLPTRIQRSWHRKTLWTEKSTLHPQHQTSACPIWRLVEANYIDMKSYLDLRTDISKRTFFPDVKGRFRSTKRKKKRKAPASWDPYTKRLKL